MPRKSAARYPFSVRQGGGGVVLSIGRIIAGTGYQYLTKEVVHGAEDYYLRVRTAAGEDQGWWRARSELSSG